EKPIVQAETPKEKPAPPAPSKPSGSYKPTPVPTTKPTPPPPAPEPKAATRSHVMAKGDTLFSLARKYGVTVQAIQDANGIKDPTKIQTNSRLIIPASK
ncbi:MAG: LysM peptidoglycan-binding domain-containing protein, partial [Verrucomicrobiales bacterium]|nr:LysM peptidoglycan-binding domain-containing protein [Verrucomicrobiales bacterium]